MITFMITTPVTIFIDISHFVLQAEICLLIRISHVNHQCIYMEIEMSIWR